MNFWLKGNVTIPSRPHTIGGLIGWARSVNRALTELRDMKIVGTVAKENPVRTIYPFQISVSPVSLKSAPGLLGGFTIDAQEEENPADGTWYLVAKVIINATTGSITSGTVEWTTTVPTDTTTNYHRVIAEVMISDGVIDYAVQYTFGPISADIGGGRDSVWMARLL
jgi:hypothetical protein